MEKFTQIDIIEDLIYDQLNEHQNVKKAFDMAYHQFYIVTKDTQDLAIINEMVHDFVSRLYNVVYTKASESEELLFDHINDEDGHFYQHYKSYTPSKNQEVVTQLNTLFEKSNEIYLNNIVSQMVDLYQMII